MQQFTIPQFIDVEDKIIGPITTRQFVILLAGAMLIAVFYKIFDFTLFIVASISVLIIAVAFSFIKVNGRPLHFFILNITQTLKRPGVRVWNHTIGKIEAEYEVEDKKQIEQVIPSARRYNASRLAELSLIVDTKGAYKGEEKVKN
ncbi:MAG: PrgI family protein [bacterium]|nr:PrgI family protein [bacterium]